MLPGEGHLDLVPDLLGTPGLWHPDCKVRWCQPPTQGWPQQVLNISGAVVIIAPALSPAIPWDLDMGMEYSEAAKRRGEGWG